MYDKRVAMLPLHSDKFEIYSEKGGFKAQNTLSE